MPQILCPDCRNRFDTCSRCWGKGYIEADPPRTPFKQRLYTDREKTLLTAGLQHLRARITLGLRAGTEDNDLTLIQKMMNEFFGDVKPIPNMDCWTTEIPTIPGNYWFRRNEDVGELCELTRFKEDEEPVFWVMGVEGFVKLSEMLKEKPVVQWQPVAKPL